MPENSGLKSLMNWQAYLDAMKERESSGDNTAVNRLGYVGWYQMGTMALKDAGYIDMDAPNSNKSLVQEKYWVKPEVPDLVTFLQNTDAQDDAMYNYTMRNFRSLKNKGVIDENSSPKDIAKALAPSHLVGATGYSRSKLEGTVGSDANGATTTEYERVGEGSQDVGETELDIDDAPFHTERVKDSTKLGTRGVKKRGDGTLVNKITNHQPAPRDVGVNPMPKENAASDNFKKKDALNQMFSLEDVVGLITGIRDMERGGKSSEAEGASKRDNLEPKHGAYSQEAGRRFFDKLDINVDYNNEENAQHRAAGGEIYSKENKMNPQDQQVPDSALPPDVQTRNQKDDVPLLGTKGEFVLPLVTVKHFGLDKLHKMIQVSREAAAERNKPKKAGPTPPGMGAPQRAAGGGEIYRNPPRTHSFSQASAAAQAPGFALGGEVPPPKPDPSGLIAKLYKALANKGKGYAAGGEIAANNTTRMINPATGGSYYINNDALGSPVETTDQAQTGGLGKSGPYAMYPEVELPEVADGEETAATGGGGMFTAADIGQLQASLGGANWGNLDPQNIWSAVTSRGAGEDGIETYDFTSIAPAGDTIQGGGGNDTGGPFTTQEEVDDYLNETLNTKGTVGEQTEADLQAAKDKLPSGRRYGGPTGKVFSSINPNPNYAAGNPYSQETGMPITTKGEWNKQQWMNYLMNQFSNIDESD